MIAAIIQSMRPKQWAKNIFLFVGMVFDRKLSNPDAFLNTLAGFVLFSLFASVVYLVNDIADLEADRLHPKKKNRPIASGRLSLKAAWITSLLILSAAVPLAFVLSPFFGWICLLYVVWNLAYSKWLKHIAILDVLILASFYVIRVSAGVSLIEVERFSPWLYVFTTFLALFIGIGKRRAEINLLEDKTTGHRRVLDGYTVPFLNQLSSIVSGMTIITYSLYTFSAENLPDNHAMMFTIPFVIYGIFRYLYLIHLEKGGAPEDLVFSDRPLQLSVTLYGISVLLIFYIF